MPTITLRRRQMFRLSMPYWVLINGQPVGVMQTREVSIQLPEGAFDVGIQIPFRLFRWQFHIGGRKAVNISEGQHIHLQITDKERWWNVLFNIDLAFWIAKLFFDLPGLWNIVYEVVSNGFFVVWIARIWFIRERYFQLRETTGERLSVADKSGREK